MSKSLRSARVCPERNSYVQIGPGNEKPHCVKIYLCSHETSIMQVISHPLLLEFKECILTKTHEYIITEMVRGTDLCSFVKKRGTLKE